MRECVGASVRAYVKVCVRACVHACVCAELCPASRIDHVDQRRKVISAQTSPT